MEEIYENVKYDKPIQESKMSQNQSGPRSSEKKYHGFVVLGLALLSLSLLAGLIGLGVHYHNSAHDAVTEFSIIKANMTEHVQHSANKLSSMNEDRVLLKTNLNEKTEERDELKANLSEKTEENYKLKANLTEMTMKFNKLQCLFRQKTESCPAGWTMFSCYCYSRSTETGSWTKGREDCKKKGADLVVIDNSEEQTFLSNLTVAETWSWIGLTDDEEENTWKWIDGTPLTLSYWETDQPDNGGGHAQWGEEDCAHMRSGKKAEENWNDRSCDASLYWICEKKL